MNITFDDLFSLPEMRDAQILASKDCMNHTIEWFHLIEIEEMSNWIKAGILVFMTGVGLKESESSLLNIIGILHRKHAAGLVINQGRYIPVIPLSVIEKAEELNLPLILLPNEVRLLDVTYQLSTLFQARQARLKQRDQILFETLMSNHVTAMDYENVDGFVPGLMYSACIIAERTQTESVSYVLAAKSDNVYRIVNQAPLRTSAKIPVLNLQGHLVLFVPFENNKTYAEQTVIIHDLIDRIERTVRTSLYAGIGDASPSLTGLRKSYQQALPALQMALANTFGRAVLHHKDLSAFRIANLDDEAEIDRIINDYLGELVHHADLLQTFMVYLENGRNMQLASEQLYIHVNSVKYRLQQIYKMLPITLSTPYDWYQIQTAMYLYRFKNPQEI